MQCVGRFLPSGVTPPPARPAPSRPAIRSGHANRFPRQLAGAEERLSRLKHLAIKTTEELRVEGAKHFDELLAQHERSFAPLARSVFDRVA